MEYTFVERQPHQKGSNWFGHEVKLNLATDREMELFEFLTEAFGKRGKRWRLNSINTFNFFTRDKSIIRFLSKNDAIRFKLSWQEDEQPESYIDQLKKMALNSSYGRGSYMKTYKPTNPIPWIHYSYLYPMISTKTLISQVKGRSLRGNPCKEIMLDYESFYSGLFGHKCDSWSTYSYLLDLDIKEEENEQTQTGSE